MSVPVHPRRSGRQGPQFAPDGGPGGAAGSRRGAGEARHFSAGGLVVDTSTGVARVAVIARLNRSGRVEWCLPKGHLEGAETAEQAAVREIEEETGIRGELVGDLGSIEYWFSVAGRRVHKTVHHYLLRATGGVLSVEGDPDAEAVDVAWVPLSELDGRLTFANERRIAATASERLAGTA